MMREKGTPGVAYLLLSLSPDRLLEGWLLDIVFGMFGLFC